MKRILSITIKRENDDSPGTSWLGEYSDKRTSDFSIDRAHSVDCAMVTGKHAAQIEDLETELADVHEDSQVNEVLDMRAQLEELQESDGCDCDESGDMTRGEYRYFNPSFNYVDDKGNARPENTPEETRKYVAEDYARMERIQSGDIGFLCIAAVAEVQFDGSLVQTITSGYCCGVESDGDYWKEVGKEQLSELRSQLSAIGFSKRAIAAAVKNLVESE